MLIQWRGSSPWVVPMSSPSSGLESSSITAARRLSGASLKPAGTLELIEAAKRRLHDAIHVEEMWHPKGGMSAKFAVSQHYKFCVVLRGEVAPAIGPKPPFTVGLSRDRPSERSARHRCLFG